MKKKTNDELIAEAIAEFPQSFKLWGQSGEFALSARSSYVSSEGQIWLYTQQNGRDACKGTPDEIRRAIVRPH